MVIICPKCGKQRYIKDASGKNPFYKNGIALCHYCGSKHSNNGVTKKCCICKQTLALSEFTNNRAEGDGLSSFCRSCNTIKMIKYRETHRELINKISAKSRHKLALK